MLTARRRSAVVGILAVLSCTLLLGVTPAQGIPMTAMTQNFDGVTAPGLPGGWENLGYDGGAWTTTESSTYPSGVTPINSPNMLCFNAHDGSSGNSGHFRMTSPVDLTRYSSVRVRFWMYHDSAAEDKDDSVRVIVANGGWSSYVGLTAFSRYSADTGWVEHEVTIGASAANHRSDVYIGFQAVGAGGNDLFLDNIRIMGERDPGCYPNNGTVGTEVAIAGTGFGAKKGKVYFQGQKTPLKVLTWSDTQISCVVGASYTNAPYDVSVLPSDPKGAAPIDVAGGFNMRSPALLSVDPAGGAPGTIITVTGNFFSTKRGKILLHDSGPGGLVLKPCKVAAWSMDTDTGASSAQFVIPKAPSGTYDIWLTVAKELPDATAGDAVTIH